MAIITMEEDYSWEIKYDVSGRPFYYNRFSERSLQCRPNCLENGGRVSIREPVIEAQYKGLWYKGIMIGPADRVRFSVQLEQAPVQLLEVGRNGIRKYSSQRRHTVPSSAQRGGSDSSVMETYDMKELFDEDVMSKLSNTLTERSEEKYDFEISQSKGKHSRGGKNSGSFTSVSDSRPRSKSWGCVPKRDASSISCSSSDEGKEDIGNLDMVPLRANPKGETIRRSRRLNAVLLDLHDLSTIRRTVRPSCE